jgi:hypothetical protein
MHASRSLGSAATLALVVALASCGTPDKPADTAIDGARRPLSADLAELEIRAHGVDRFTTCPPPGDLGHYWVPPPFAWQPPPPKPRDPSLPPLPIDSNYITRTADGETLTERAIEVTHRDFRSCYRKGLVHDPTQDGHVAIVLRVGPDGTVAKVEEYAACELSPDSVACMKKVASALRFPPPPEGSDTITLPAVFTSRDGIPRTRPALDDGYTANAYVTLEELRPALHACEEQARRELRPVQATGTFRLDLARDGSVVHTHIDPWTGDQPLLLCAARALGTLRFDPPSSGAGTVIARLNFNPRQGTR